MESDLLADIKGTWVAAVRDAAFKAKKRRFANYVKTVLSLLFGWAVSRKIMEYNPAAKVKKIRRPKDAPDANRPWRRAELRVVMAAAPFETTLAVGLAVCTALREGDVVHWPWSGYQDGKIQGCDHKTGKPIWMPAHPLLQELLDEQRRLHLLRAAKGSGSNVLPLSLATEHPIVTGQRGRPLTEAGLRSNFFKVIRALKREGPVAPGLTFLGLRSTTVVMLVEAGCDDATIQAVTGQSLAMVAHSRRQVNRKKLAARAIGRLNFDEESEAD